MSNRVVLDEVDSNIPTFEQGVSHSVPISQMPGSDEHYAVFQMMNEWFT